MLYRSLLVAGMLGFGIGSHAEAAGPATAPAALAQDAGLRLVLNVPANRLDVFENGERTRSYTVSVGKEGHRTPRGNFRISQVIWNPSWVPPNSPWARGRRPEPPGVGNPMGRVKMYFAPLLYIHGSPETSDLGQPASHGCVRMSNPDVTELARLVHEYVSPEVTHDEMNRLEVQPRKTKTVRLKNTVPLQIVYEVAEVRDDYLEIHPDVYRLAGRGITDRAVRALVAAGHPESAIDRERLADLISASGRAGLTVPVETVLAAAAANAVAGQP
jgi:murein L,D-transpeptidase YcbB/YkuD